MIRNKLRPLADGDEFTYKEETFRLVYQWDQGAMVDGQVKKSIDQVWMVRAEAVFVSTDDLRPVWKCFDYESLLNNNGADRCKVEIVDSEFLVGIPRKQETPITVAVDCKFFVGEKFR